MASSKNGSNGSNGATDPIGESVDKVLKLYDRFRQAAAESITREAVEIPELGLTVYVQTLSGDDRDSYESWQSLEQMKANEEGREVNLRGARARVAVWCTVDEDGNKLFTDADREWLGRMHSGAINRIFTVADRLSGISGSSQADIRKNSEVPTGDSG